MNVKSTGLLIILVVLLAVPTVWAAPVRVGAGLFMEPETNPVNQGVDEPVFRITLLPGDLVLSNNTWSWREYLSSFTGEFTDEVKEEFVAAVPEDGYILDLRSWSNAGLGVSSFSTNASVRLIGSASLSRDLVELALMGNEFNRYYSLDGSQLQAAAFGDVSAGVAFNLGPRVRIGGRYHRLMGIAYVDAVATGGGEVIYNDAGNSFHGSMRLDLVQIYGEGLHGDGNAYDIGVMIQPTENLGLGFAVLDLGQITWWKVRSERYEGELDPDEGEGQTPRFEKVQDEVLDSLIWSLPTRYELSMGYRLSKSLHFGAAYTRTVHETKQGFTVDIPDQVRAMVSWNGFGVVPMALGMVYQPGEAPSFSGEAGLKIGPLRTRIGLTDIQSLFGGDAGKHLGLRVDVSMLF